MRTKIVATLGPASQSRPMLQKMIRAGMSVARLNFSHGSYENHAELISHIRVASKIAKRPVAILQDLQGPKIRVSEMAHPFVARNGAVVTIGKDFGMDFDVSGSVKKGDRVLIEDGLIELHVLRVRGKNIVCRVKSGGKVQQHKGMNFPDTHLKARLFTAKDRADLHFGLEQGVDYVALSFVRSSRDIEQVRKIIEQKRLPYKPGLVAKIEMPQALKNIDEIIAAADGIMIARGDLGVETPAARVPVVQKEIVRKCLNAAKPVIVATQMLESMIKNPRPTRAEISDVANAVIDRTDAVMLSGESATGKYPVQAVTVMKQTITAVESSEFAGPACVFSGSDEHGVWGSALANSACQLALGVKAAAIIGASDSGATARFLSHQRPGQPIVILTDKEWLYRKLALFWGVEPLLVQRYHTVPELLAHAVAAAKKAGLVKRGQKVVLVAGNPLGQRVNMLEVQTVR